MKLLLTGASGQLGRHLRASLPAAVALVSTDRSGQDGVRGCDLSDRGEVEDLLASVRPEVIINCAAWTAVDAAEDHPAEAYRLNRDLPAWLAAWCQGHDACLISYSTDYVFSGRPDHGWRESDPPAPTSVYGDSKLAGEAAIMASDARALILRTAWVYSALPGNFLSAIMKRARAADPLRVVADQVGCPTWAGDLARASAALLPRLAELNGPQRLHLAGRDAMSWHEFACRALAKAVELGQLERAVPIEAIASGDWPQKAERPAWSVLDCGVYEQWTGDRMMTVDEALTRCLSQGVSAAC